jgi:hypothetical protein
MARQESCGMTYRSPQKLGMSLTLMRYRAIRSSLDYITYCTLATIVCPQRFLLLPFSLLHNHSYHHCQSTPQALCHSGIYISLTRNKLVFMNLFRIVDSYSAPRNMFSMLILTIIVHRRLTTHDSIQSYREGHL